jgi:hypothetical protein
VQCLAECGTKCLDDLQVKSAAVDSCAAAARSGWMTKGTIAPLYPVAMRAAWARAVVVGVVNHFLGNTMELKDLRNNANPDGSTRELSPDEMRQVAGGMIIHTGAVGSLADPGVAAAAVANGADPVAVAGAAAEATWYATFGNLLPK